MKRFLLWLAGGLAAVVMSADTATTVPPAGGTPMVVLARTAKLALTKGGAIELKAGTSLVFLGVDQGTGNVRVRYRSSEGTVPATVLVQDVKNLPAPAPESAPKPPPGFPAEAKPLTAADLAHLPPEVRAAIESAKAEAAHAAPGQSLEGRTVTTTTSTPWEKVAPGTPAPAIPAGAKVEKTVTTTRTETHSTPITTQQRFKTKEEAERAMAGVRAHEEAEAQAKAEQLAREEAAKLAPPK